ncbi:MAG: hypothetical protein C4581_00105 [Nitrospiraceae bacterium]|nr:MAG: hypothetical protein C4581_00105 [Nitrospiraceae bacterium]
MKNMTCRKHQENKKMISGKRVAGIDPAKEKHQGTVVDREGLQVGSSFSIPVSYEGYNERLWEGLARRIGQYSPEDMVFAVETSCNLWKTLVVYLSKRGYNPL